MSIQMGRLHENIFGRGRLNFIKSTQPDPRNVNRYNICRPFVSDLLIHPLAAFKLLHDLLGDPPTPPITHRISVSYGRPLVSR